MSDNKTDPTSSKKSLDHLSPEVVGKLNPRELYEQKRFLELAHHPGYLRGVPAGHVQGLLGWVEKNKGTFSPEEYESAKRSLEAALRAKASASQTAPPRQTDSPEEQFAVIDRLIGNYSFEGTEEDEADLEEAVRLCRIGLTSDPGNAGFYRRRAEAYLLQERFDKALADYTKAIEMEPSNVEYYLARAQFHGQQRPDEALRDYTKAIELDPSSWEAYEGRAEVLLGFVGGGNLPDIDKAERALPDLLKAIELLSTPGARSFRYPPPPPSIPVEQLSRAKSDVYYIALALRQRAERRLAAGDGEKALQDGSRVLDLVDQVHLGHDDLLPWASNLLAKAYSSTTKPVPAAPAMTSWPAKQESPSTSPFSPGMAPARSAGRCSGSTGNSPTTQ